MAVSGEISGWVSTEVELSKNLVKWCEVTCTSDALKNLPPQHEKYDTHKWRSVSQHLVYSQDLIHDCNLNKMSTNSLGSLILQLSDFKEGKLPIGLLICCTAKSIVPTYIDSLMTVLLRQHRVSMACYFSLTSLQTLGEFHDF